MPQLQNLLPTFATLAGFGLLVLGAVVLVAGRVNIGLSEDVTGLPAQRLIGLGLAVMGFVLLVGLSRLLLH